MNKLFFLFICTCVLISPLEMIFGSENTLEFRSAAFFHQSKKFRHVYDPISVDYQLDGTLALSPSFELWVEFDYTTKSKKKECYYTKIKLTNCSLGLQYVHRFFPKLEGYIGTGVSLVRANLHNRSCCSDEWENKTAWGSLSKVGVRYWVTDNLFLDVFTDYLYQEVHFKKSVNVGGFKTGLGIGIGF